VSAFFWNVKRARNNQDFSLASLCIGFSVRPVLVPDVQPEQRTTDPEQCTDECRNAPCDDLRSAVFAFSGLIPRESKDDHPVAKEKVPDKDNQASEGPAEHGSYKQHFRVLSEGRDQSIRAMADVLEKSFKPVGTVSASPEN
jgi:hypothetical protein